MIITILKVYSVLKKMHIMFSVRSNWSIKKTSYSLLVLTKSFSFLNNCNLCRKNMDYVCNTQNEQNKVTKESGYSSQTTLCHIFFYICLIIVYLQEACV